MRNRKIFRLVLTFVLAIAMAYPLLFWGTATCRITGASTSANQMPCITTGTAGGASRFIGGAFVSGLGAPGAVPGWCVIRTAVRDTASLR